MLLGDHAIQQAIDTDWVGTVEGFAFKARRSGTASSISVYVEARDRATTLFAGLYSSRHGHPQSLLASGSKRLPKAGAWNSVAVRAAKLRSGATYWLAVLAKGGAMYFRDRNRGACATGRSFTRKLPSLPKTWPTGPSSRDCFISAFVKGVARPSSATGTSKGGTKVFGINVPAGTTAPTNGSPITTAPSIPGTAPTLPPLATASPVISGTPVVGQTLTTSDGSWLDSPTSYAYQWESCDSLGVICTAISGATSNSYTLSSNDVGHTIRAIVTATNAGGSTPATSAATSAVTASGGSNPPVNTVGPYFTASTGTTSSCSNGCAVVGQTLGVNPGTWTNSPTDYSYQWERCTTTSAQPPTTGSCSAITGATGSTYTVQSADVGHALAPIVTANNGSGVSSPTSLSGTCDTGEMLGATSGSTSSVPTAQPAGCSPISAVVATTQAGEMFCTNAVTTCGYADPLNQTVGVPAGVTPSTTGACASYASGGTISSGTVTLNGCKVTGQIYITGGNVTITNSDLSLTDESGAGAPIVMHGGSLTASYDTIHGLGITSSSSMAWAVYDYKSTGAISLDHIFFYNGDRIFMNLAASSVTPTVTNSFCWSAAQVVFNGSTEHYECIYTQPPSHLTVKSTALLNFRSQTGANYVDDNTGSCCGTIDLENNLLGGGDYTFYGGGSLISSETYLANRITRSIYTTGGLYGPGSYNASSGFSSSGNIWDDTAATANP